MWNKTTYPFLVQALCIIPLKSIRMWASFRIFAMSCNYDILEESKAGIYPLNGYLSLSYRGEVLELGEFVFHPQEHIIT